MGTKRDQVGPGGTQVGLKWPTRPHQRAQTLKRVANFGDHFGTMFYMLALLFLSLFRDAFQNPPNLQNTESHIQKAALCFATQPKIKHGLGHSACIRRYGCTGRCGGSGQHDGCTMR